MIYKYLKHSNILNNLNKTLILTTSAPTYCSDYEHLKLFLQILENIGNKEENIADIFTILKHPAATRNNHHIILDAEKYLLGMEDLNVNDVKRIVYLLEKNGMQEAAQLVVNISQFQRVSSGKYPEIKILDNAILNDIDAEKYLLEIGVKHEILSSVAENKFEQILKAHLVCFFSILSQDFIKNDATNELLNALLEAQNCFRTFAKKNINFREYKFTIISLFNRHIISANDEYSDMPPLAQADYDPSNSSASIHIFVNDP
jgi:hypothetical protein